MEKYIECHNCQNQYDCERTYLGGCTDGKEWEDDKDINVRSKKILANRVYSDTTLKKWSKEDLIEHIRILEHNWSCAEENLNNSVKNSEKIFYEQKAEIELLSKVIGSSKRKTKILELQKEIERLTIAEKQYLSEIERLNKSCGLFDIKLQEQIKETYDYVHKADKLKKRNAELQKQVDELTLIAKNVVRENRPAIMCFDSEMVDLYNAETNSLIENIKQQAVKDTAKEIYDYIRSIEERGLPATCVGEWVKNRLKERYGVEVE